MRFDTTLYYHVGEPYDWGLLFDEMQVKRSLRPFAEEVMPRFATPAPGRRPESDFAPAEMRA